MSDIEDLGVCEDCGHAVEAHGDGGCQLCDCENEHGRAAATAGETAVVEAPPAEGGAGG